MNAVLERDKQVPSTAQYIGLKTSLAMKRDKSRFHRPTTAHELLHNANLVVGNVAEEPGHKDDEQNDSNDDRRD